jgi:hypothetical protein
MITTAISCVRIAGTPASKEPAATQVVNPYLSVKEREKGYLEGEKVLDTFPPVILGRTLLASPSVTDNAGGCLRALGRVDHSDAKRAGFHAQLKGCPDRGIGDIGSGYRFGMSLRPCLDRTDILD